MFGGRRRPSIVFPSWERRSFVVTSRAPRPPEFVEFFVNGGVPWGKDISLSTRRPTKDSKLKAPVAMVEIGTVFKRRKATYGWIKNTVSPNHFCKVLLTPGLGLLPVTDAVRLYFGEVPDDITLTTNIGCIWTITVADVNGKACLVKGWPAFAIAHNLYLGYLLMFKKLGRMEYKVIIFDNTGCELVRACPEHPMNFKKYEDEDE